MPDYTAKDFVKVKDVEGRVQEHPVPKAWIGTSLLPPGWKAASAKDVEAEDTDTDEKTDTKADTKTEAKPGK